MLKLKPNQIIQKISGIQTIILPKIWFYDLPDNNSVFDSLYEWMLNDGRVTVVSDDVIHNTTYVGDALYRKLISAEKKRIKKVCGLVGSKLDEAVSWSDINSGPKTEIGGCKIAGEVILVVPESSQDELDSFSSNLYEKNHQSEVNRIKSIAAGGTFYEWLLSQCDRPDRVGDLAKDVQADETFPQKENQFELIKFYFQSQGAPSDAIDSFKEGWLEYLQQYPDRVQSYAWCSNCGEKIDVKDAILTYCDEHWIHQLAEVRHRSAHSMMLEAITQYLECEKRSEQFRDEMEDMGRVPEYGFTCDR